MPIRPLVLSLALALACANTPSTPDNGGPAPGPGPGGPEPAVVTRDGVEYRADVLVMESFPVQLSGRVTLTNRSGAAVRLVFPDGCVALLRAYAGATRIWDQSEEVGCTMALVEVDLAPGASREFQTPTSSAYEVLDDEHPDGEYRLAVYLRPQGGEVEIDAGETQLAVPR